MFLDAQVEMHLPPSFRRGLRAGAGGDDALRAAGRGLAAAGRAVHHGAAHGAARGARAGAGADGGRRAERGDDAGWGAEAKVKWS